MALALSAAPLLGVELSAEDVLLERQAPPKLVHNVAVCSRWSPRYEALHVLPWLAHHNLLGVDHFFMYLAPPYTNASSPLELRVRALVAASPMVTLLQTDRVPTILGSASEGTRSLDTEGVSLVDCMQRLRRSARWGIGFLDIDELLVVGDVRAATHGAGGASAAGARAAAACGGAHGGDGAGSLARLLGGLADDVVAVPLSRVGFSSGGHERRPLRKTQAEAYTRRAPLHIALEFIPKLFRRGNAISPSDWNDNQHAIRLPRGRGRMAYANGATVAPLGAPAGDVGMVCRRLLPGCASSAECPCYTTTSRDGFFATAGGANGSNGLVARIHHYMTRSVDECRLKVADIACCHTGHCVLPHRMGCASKWRANDGTHCTRVSPTGDAAVDDDQSAACLARGARARMRELFGVALGDLAASYSPPAAPAAAGSAAAFRGRQPPPTESVAAFLAAHHGPFREEDLKRAEAEAREADASGNHGHKTHGHKKHGHKNGDSAVTGGGGRP